MTTEGQLSSSSVVSGRTLSADSPTQGTVDHLVVRIDEAMPIGSPDLTFVSDPDTHRHPAAFDDSTSTILVPLGELDYFGVQHVTDAAGPVVGTHRSVTFDLSAVSFCDSSIYSFLDWVRGLPEEVDVTIVTSPAIERVLSLLAEGV